MTAIAAVLVALLVLLLIGFAKHPPRWFVARISARETKKMRERLAASSGACRLVRTSRPLTLDSPRVAPSAGDSGHSQQHVASFEAALDRIYQASLSSPAAKGFSKPLTKEQEFAVNAAPRRI